MVGATRTHAVGGTPLKLRYQGFDKEGRVVKGHLDADSLREARSRLYQKGLEVTLLQPQPESAWPKLLQWSKAPKTRDWMFFCKQFAAYDKAGIDQPSALKMLADTSSNPTLRNKLQQVTQQLYGGASMIEAMQSTGGFPALMLGLLAAGERSGGRDKALVQLTQHYQREQTAENAIRSGLVYPTFVLLSALGVTYFLLASIVPQMAQLIEGLGGQMPLITQIVIAIAKFTQTWGWLGPLLALALWIGVRRYRQTPKGQTHLDRLSLQLPVVGKLLRMQMLARICRVSALLLASAIPLQDSLRTVAIAVGNNVYRDLLNSIDRELKQGLIAFHQGLAQHPQHFDSLLVKMTLAGERTGKLPEMLNHAAEYYEQEVDTLAKQLTEALTPALTLLLGGMIGSIVAAVLLPYFGILQQLSR